MPRLLPALFAAALPAMLCAVTAARAEITAPELWAHWQALGGTAATSSDTTGDSIGLETVSFTRSVAGSPLTATLERMQLRPAPNSGVTVTIPGGQTLSLESDGERVVFRLGPETLQLRTTGTLPAPVYALDAERMSLTLEDWQAPDRPAEADFAAVLRGINGSLATDAGTPARLAVTMAGFDIAAAAVDPVSGTMTHEATQSDIVIDAVLADTDGQASLAAGQGRIMTSTTTPRGATLRLEATKQAHSVNLDWTGLTTRSRIAVEGIEAALGGLPLPVDPFHVTVSRAALTVSGPAAATDGPAPVTATGALEGVAPDAAAWSALDPSGALPRDPAYLRFNITGTSRPATTGVDRAAGPGSANGAPIMVPETLDLKNLTLGIAGAEAQATGKVTLPPTSPGGPPDLAMPAGEVTVNATGILGLMQALAAAGIVPAEQLMGAQMMLGMFATIGPGDTLRTVIEAGSDGSLSVNGTRVR